MFATNKIIFLLFIVQSFDIVMSIKSMSNIVAIEGRPVTMDCLVPVDNVFKQLYSIKWYKQHEDIYYEFYSLSKLSLSCCLLNESTSGLIYHSTSSN